MTASHSYINTRGVISASSNFACAEVSPVGNQGAWQLARFVKNLAPEKIRQLMSRDGSVKKQSRLYKTMTPI